MQIHNENERTISLQVSKMKQLPAGDYTQEQAFLIKNISGQEISLEILLADDVDYLETTIMPGWNPEMVKGVRNVPENSIQIGW